MPLRATAATAVCIAFLLAAGPAAGQLAPDQHFTGGRTLFLGYVANAPLQLLGVGAGMVIPGLPAWGVYMDGKTAAESPARSSFLLPITSDSAEAMGDQLFSRRAAWTSVNVAAVRSLTPEFAIYLGGGISWRAVYNQYVSEDVDRGEMGRYWVEDPDDELTHPNFIGGAFLRMGRRLMFQFGGETAPTGFTAGVQILLP